MSESIEKASTCHLGLVSGGAGGPPPGLAIPSDLPGKLCVESPAALLASIEACLTSDQLRRGAELMHGRCLTSAPFLSGVFTMDAQASGAVARAFIREMSQLGVRGECLREVANGFTTRMCRRARVRAGNPKDRLCNPLVALQGAPGGGKSAVLDILSIASTHSLWCEDVCPDAGMRAVLNCSVPVTITYNSGSPLCLSTYDSNVQLGLAVRILHSCLVNDEALSIGQFYELFPAGSIVTAERAVRTCLLAAERQTGAKRGILLLVDEVVKLLEKQPDAELISALGSLLDTFPSEQLNLVCTTLDAVYLNRECTKSGRSIQWARLPALGQQAVEALLRSALAPRAGDSDGPAAPGDALGLPAKLPVALRIVISDAAGHPRTLHYVLEAAQSLGERCASLAQLREEVLAMLPAACAPSYAAVRLALLGNALPLNDSPLRDHGDGRQLHELIAAGDFINTDVTGNEFSLVVPKLSMLRLLQFARVAVDSTVEAGSWKEAADCIQALAELGDLGASAGGTLAGDPFEDFMARWLQLMAVIRRGEPLTALSLFHGEMLAPHAPSEALTSKFTLGSIMWRGRSARHLGAALEHGELKDSSSGLLLTLGDSNPAFDLLLTAPCCHDGSGAGSAGVAGGAGGAGASAACEYIAIAVETRFSAVGSSLVDTRFQGKWECFRGRGEDVHSRPEAEAESGAGASAEAPSVSSVSVRRLLNRMSPPPKHVVYVYAAAKEVGDAARLQTQMCKHDVILLSNATAAHKSLASIHRTLTPTLADRAFFLLNLKSA